MKTKFKILFLIIITVIGVIAAVSILGFKVFSSFKEIDEEKAFAVKEMDEIQVNMVRERVHILRTETSNEVRFHYYGKSKQELKLVSEINDKTIVVAAKCEDNPLPRNYDPTPEDMYLDIYIPENYKENISIHLTTGTVQIDSIEVANFTLDTNTGGLKADQINAGKVFIKTTTGNIDINKTDTDNLDIKGASSAVSIHECFVKSAKIETTSGGIDLKNCSGSLNLKANSGKVQVSYHAFEDQNINIVTSSGSIELQLPNPAEFLLEAKTSSGNFKSDFPIQIANQKDIKGQIGTKKNKIMLQTSSGSMKLLKQ